MIKQIKEITITKDYISDFPYGIVDKNAPADVGDMGLIPYLGIFHMFQSNQVYVPQLLNCCSRVRKLQLLRRCVETTEAPKHPKPCSTTREATIMRSLAPASERSGLNSKISTYLLAGDLLGLAIL